MGCHCLLLRSMHLKCNLHFFIIPYKILHHWAPDSSDLICCHVSISSSPSRQAWLASIPGIPKAYSCLWNFGFAVPSSWNSLSLIFFSLPPTFFVFFHSGLSSYAVSSERHSMVILLNIAIFPKRCLGTYILFSF